MRAGWLVLCAAVVGCQQTRSLEVPPEAGSAPVTLLVLVRDGKPQRAFALENGSRWPDVVLDDGLTMMVGTYSMTLRGLGIEAGELDLGAEGAELPPLPKRELLLSAPFDGWVESAEPSAYWAAFKVPLAADRCFDFERVASDSEVVPGSSGVGSAWAAAVGFGVVWVGNARGIWEARVEGFRQVLGGSVTSTLTPTGTSTAPIIAGDASARGQNFLYQAGGQLWRGGFRRGFEMMGRTTGPGVASGAWLAAGERDRAQLYILDSNGGLWRWEESGLDTILVPDPARPIGREGALVWLDIDDVLVLGPRGGQLLRVRNLEVDVVEPPSESPLVLIARTERDGIVVGDRSGHLHRFADGRWLSIAAPAAPGTTWVSSFSGGLLYGPDSGAMKYISETNEDCTGEIQLGRGIFSTFDYDQVSYVFSSSGILGEVGPIVVTNLRSP